MSAIIVNYNSGHDLLRCVASIKGQNCAIETIVVDNGSGDGSVARVLDSFNDIRVLSDSANDGFAGGANRGAAAASADILMVLNPDVTLEPGCASALIAALTDVHLDRVVAPIVVEANGSVVEFGFTIDYVGDLIALPERGKALYVSGCALATTRRVFDSLGGFESAFFMFCEDLDFCWRALLRGCDVAVVPDARVLHRGGSSTPGGYVTAGSFEVTAFRIAFRERNTLATLVRCGPAWWVVFAVASRLVRMGLIAIVALAKGRPDLAGALAAGLAWNIRRIRQIVRERRAIGSTRAMRRRVLRERIHHGLSQVRILLKYGLPHFVDQRERR